MAKHIRIKTVENAYVHIDGERNDYTLCGLDIMGDPTLCIDEAEITNRKVDCPTCIAIIQFCKKIKASELKTS